MKANPRYLITLTSLILMPISPNLTAESRFSDSSFQSYCQSDTDSRFRIWLCRRLHESTQSNARELSFNPNTVTVRTAYQTESLYAYIHTKQFFLFSDHKAVLSIRFDNTVMPFTPDASIQLFELSTPVDAIIRWINNQYSDAFSSNAAQPIRTVTLPSDLIRIQAEHFKGQRSGEFGDEYDHYELDYAISTFTVDEVLKLEAFNYQAPVYYRTKDID